MVSFCKQLLAICLVAGDAPSPPLCAATTSVDSTPNVVTPFSAVQELTMAVKELQSQQKAVVAALSSKSRPNRSSSQESLRRRCFFCKEMGHIARNCPLGLTVHPQDLLVNLLDFHKPPRTETHNEVHTMRRTRSFSSKMCK